ncbi:hypothetical protein BgAZ_108160 [Babesia gibsoni]|uniref:Transcription initiation factor TFIID subunit 8 n=1 Tax=Babesia gibsoni TaxID=33632 RepID=A0AAD8USE6_BABGI|nr:hypothetical protein BgAZ_108160 [Babesia gibsoni]
MEASSDPPFVEGDHESSFKVNHDSVIISLAQSHRSARSSNVIYQEPLETDRGEYYEEWLQKCVAWIAFSHGIKRMDCYSLEFLSNFVANEIRKIGRKAAMLSRTRGCDSSNFVDVVGALERINPSLHSMIFKDKVVSTAKQLPKQVVALSHTSLIQPALLAQPSALYFECMMNASSHLSEINTGGESSEGMGAEENVVYNSLAKPCEKGLTWKKDDGNLDLEYFVTSSSRDTYSLKSDEVYQKIVASRPPFAHKHFPLLPPALRLNDGDPNEMNYTVDNQSNTKELMARQNILLQMELPLLHRVQVRPDLQQIRDTAMASRTKNKE